MPNMNDVFEADAFSIVSLTAAINEIDHVPGRAGELCFVGEGSGIPTTKATIESKETGLSVIPTSPRGAPAPKEVRDPRKMVEFELPHIQIEDVIHAASIQNVRQFGSGDALQGAQDVVNEQLTKMALRQDLTLEYLRLNALKGKVIDADGSTIVDLFSAFGVSEPDPISFPAGAASDGNSLRTICQGVKRQMEKASKLLLPRSAQVVALCGDDFFDEFVSHPDVALAYTGWEAAQGRLADDVRSGFNFGGIVFENYRGTDDTTGEEASDGDLVGKVGIASGECRLFLTGVPGLYVERYAPADFFEDVNAVGLPRYAKLWPDNSNRYITVHVQSNPLPLCTRPATLMKGSFA